MTGVTPNQLHLLINVSYKPNFLNQLFLDAHICFGPLDKQSNKKIQYLLIP